MPRFRQVTPRRAVCAILQAWFAESAGSTHDALGLTRFQADAARRIEALLALRRGALLADSVGLGKTFVALAVIARALEARSSVLLVIPATLRAHWQRHLHRLPDEVRARCRTVTHTALSFGRVPAVAPDLVVVDEAHGFRNPRRRRYEALTRLTAQSRVLLLTATPVNNSVEDLYHLIRLFAGDGDFRDLGVPDLRAAFRAGPDDAHAMTQVDRVLQQILIRRSRAMAETERHVRFPQRANPEVVRYDLAGSQVNLDDLFGAIAELSFMAGDPAELMRMHLLKRLESSAAAFASTVEHHHRFVRSCLDALRHGRALSRAEFRHFGQTVDGSMQLMFDDILLAGSLQSRARSQLADQLCREQELLLKTRDAARLLVDRDQKLERLERLLDTLRGEKILLFTQFRETAVSLWRRLQRHWRVALVHGEEAWLGAGRVSRAGVIRSFAPHANEGRTSARLEIDLLIATDVLAEGLNLQDAAIIVNYDLPWNPVVLMQRIGRIDRMGSPHETIRVINFLPDRGLDQLLGLLERVELKLHTIERTVGADGAVLDIPAVGTARRAVELVTNALPYQTGELDAHAALERLRQHCSGEQTGSHGPVQATVCGTRDATLLAVRWQGQTRVLIEESGSFHEDVSAAARFLEEVIDAVPAGTVPQAIEVDRMIDYLRSNARAAELRGAPRQRSPEQAAASLLLDHMTDCRDPDLQRRADAILIALRQPLATRAAQRVSQVLTSYPSMHRTLSDLLRQFEIAVAADGPASEHKTLPPNVIAVLRMRARTLGSTS